MSEISKKSFPINLDDPLPKAIHVLYDQCVEAAMIVIFNRDRIAARRKVRKFRAGFKVASDGTRNISLHESVVTTAACLLGKEGLLSTKKPRIRKFLRIKMRKYNRCADQILGLT